MDVLGYLVLLFFGRGCGLYPVVIAANPHDPNQFAIGLIDGGVLVIEPLESESKWGMPPPVENGSSNPNVQSNPASQFVDLVVGG